MKFWHKEHESWEAKTGNPTQTNTQTQINLIRKCEKHKRFQTVRQCMQPLLSRKGCRMDSWQHQTRGAWVTLGVDFHQSKNLQVRFIYNTKVSPGVFSVCPWPALDVCLTRSMLLTFIHPSISYTRFFISGSGGH